MKVPLALSSYIKTTMVQRKAGKDGAAPRWECIEDRCDAFSYTDFDPSDGIGRCLVFLQPLRETTNNVAYFASLPMSDLAEEVQHGYVATMNKKQRHAVETGASR